MTDPKDIKRGTARLADGATLLQHGDSESDHAHVGKQTPMETKRREMENDPRYVTPVVATDQTREKSTSRKRRDKDVKPV